MVARWILTFPTKRKVGVYLSDISGAFDRVDKKRLLNKMKQTGVNEHYLRFLDSYLQPRSGTVLVEGAKSTPMVMENTIFQGTVLGPMLRNVFFRDVDDATTDTEVAKAKFADDLTLQKDYDSNTTNEEILEDLQKCQQEVHAWGERNRVCFDANKEAFAVLHTLTGKAKRFGCWAPRWT